MSDADRDYQCRVVAFAAVVATVVSTVFAQATSVRYHRGRKPHELAWTVALALFALASVALFLGASTGWDGGTYRAFFLLGAVLNVPWLALGTVYLMGGRRLADRVRTGLVFFSGLAVGALLSTPIHGTLPDERIPVGKEHLDALPRILAAVGSGLGATVLLVGALTSSVRYLGRRGRGEPGAARLAGANGLIALGTLVLSSGGLVQGRVANIDKDEAFAICTATGISVIYAGFWIASLSGVPSRSARRSTLPANV